MKTALRRKDGIIRVIGVSKLPKAINLVEKRPDQPVHTMVADEDEQDGFLDLVTRTSE